MGKRGRYLDLNPALPFIGEPADYIAENSWNIRDYDNDPYTLEDISAQQETIDSYGGYAIFDTHTDAGHDMMSLRNGMAVHIVGEAQTNNCFQMGTMWIVEFTDGYTGSAYFDELEPLAIKDKLDYFGKSMIFDGRGMIYKIAEYCIENELDEAAQQKYIDEQWQQFMEDSENGFCEMVSKIIADRRKKTEFRERFPESALFFYDKSFVKENAETCEQATENETNDNVVGTTEGEPAQTQALNEKRGTAETAVKGKHSTSSRASKWGRSRYGAKHAKKRAFGNRK